jgi:subtilisin family serine protease
MSILILASITTGNFLAFGEKPIDSKEPVVILFSDNVSNNEINLIKSYGGEITKTYKIINGLAANLPTQAIENLQKNPNVLSVDPDIEFHAIELNADQTIRADQIWPPSSYPSTGNGVKVAILDTGIDTDHQEFGAGRILKCNSEMGNKEPTCEDLHGHGTHVAGIIGAQGVVSSAKGVAYDVSYLIDKVLDKRGSGSLSGIIAGMDWAINNDAQIISMSLGTSPYSNQSSSNCDSWYPSMTSAVANANANNVSVVVAAGNSGADGVGLPACISKTIAVAAVDDNDKIAYFSSVGGAVKDHGISAPGVSIYSSLPDDKYASWSGTSMATPVVTGSIALLLEDHPTLTSQQVKDALFSNACTSNTSPNCSFITNTPNTNYGYGRIDVLRSISSLGSPIAPQASISIDDISMNEGDSGTTNFVFTITRSGDTSTSFDVDFATSDDSATLVNGDYVQTGDIVHFGSGVTSQEITVVVNGDTDPESNESFFVDLSNCSTCSIVDSRGVGTIIDDDTVSVDITFAHYNAKRDVLTVRATCTDSTETLSVFTYDGVNWDPLGDMRNKGDGTYDGRFSGPGYTPSQIKVAIKDSSDINDVISFRK